MTTRSTTARPAPTTSLKQLLTGYPLVAFFVLAFAGSWLIELPFILGQQGIGLFPYTLSTNWLWLMPFTGPTMAALLMTAVLDGKAGVRALLRRLIQWRVGLRWYLLALFGPPLILLAGASGMFGIGPAEALIQHWPLIFSDYLAVVPIVLILGGPLGEEPGWRGFALPRLQRQYGALAGTLILGLLHGLWHAPLFLIAGAYAPFTLIAFVQFIVPVIVNAIIWTWVFNHTRASLLIMVLLHAAMNAASGLVGPLLPPAPILDWLPSIAYGVVALLLIAATRGQLGYQPAPEAPLTSTVQPAYET
jgi:membrane protease YdiL (CAAX protease family)